MDAKRQTPTIRQLLVHLRPSTRAYLLTALCYAINLTLIGSSDTSIWWSTLNAMGFISLLFGIYRSWLEIQAPRVYDEGLRAHAWYRLTRVIGWFGFIGLGTVAYFIGYVMNVGSSADSSAGTVGGILFLVIAVFVGRAIEKTFIYVVLGEQSRAISIF